MSCGDGPEENVPQPSLDLDFVASLTEILLAAEVLEVLYPAQGPVGFTHSPIRFLTLFVRKASARARKTLGGSNVDPPQQTLTKSSPPSLKSRSCRFTTPAMHENALGIAL